MGKTSDDIINIYYGYLPSEKGEEYANEAFNKNVENLLKEGGTLYPNTRETIINLSKKYKLYIVSNCVKGYIESFFIQVVLKIILMIMKVMVELFLVKEKILSLS